MRLRRMVRPFRYRIDAFTYNNSNHLERLNHYAGSLRNRPLLIVGNGPSLIRTPLEQFEGAPAIGMNKINLIFQKTTWRPTWIMASNPLVIRQNSEFFTSTEICVLLSWKNRWMLRNRRRYRHHFFMEHTSSAFSRSFAEGLGVGGTITYAALQFGYITEANPIILFGVDHYFRDVGAPNSLGRIKGVDSNHFDAAYFTKGSRWHYPDLSASELAYQSAKIAFEQDGRRIYDATIDGHLDIFQKLTLDEALEIVCPGNNVVVPQQHLRQNAHLVRAILGPEPRA